MKTIPIRTPSPVTITRADIPSLVNNWGFVRKGLLGRAVKRALVQSQTT